MADETVRIDVAARFTGEGELRRGAAEFERLGDKSRAALTTTTAPGPIAAAGNAWRGLALGLGVAGVAYAGVSQAAGRAYATLREGAVLATTTERFGKLAAQINSTGDALLGKLRTATKGMISDAELMASASGIVSLRLAENEDQVVRLATVVGTLGWDMQQVILTFANLSTMRLDALGLSVDEVKAKQKELMEQGMSTAAAFKEAVIQAGEARLDVGGVSEAEQSFKQAEAAVANFKNTLLLSITATLDQAGAFDALSQAAANMNMMGPIREQLAQMRADGELTLGQWLHFQDMMAGGSSAAAIQIEIDQIKTRDALTDTADELNSQLGAWQLWARQVSIQTGFAAQEAAAAANDIFFSLVGIRDGLGDNMPLAPRRDDFDYMAAGADIGSERLLRQRQAEWMRESMRRSRGADADRAAQVEQEARALRSYGGALSYVDTEAQKAAEAHSRFMASFNAELRAKPEDGLYNAEGVANVEAVNKALYEQVEAAGASAATLALLGVATGQFTQEQAEAALKAAVLHEQIKAIAESVVAGDLSINDALGQLGQARAALDAANLSAVAGTGEAAGDVTIAVTADTATADANLDGTASQLDALTSEEYIATVGMDIQAVVDGTTEASRLIGSIPDTKTMTIRWEQAGADVIAALRALGIIV